MWNEGFDIRYPAMPGDNSISTITYQYIQSVVPLVMILTLKCNSELCGAGYHYPFGTWSSSYVTTTRGVWGSRCGCVEDGCKLLQYHQLLHADTEIKKTKTKI